MAERFGAFEAVDPEPAAAIAMAVSEVIGSLTVARTCGGVHGMREALDGFSAGRAAED